MRNLTAVLLVSFLAACSHVPAERNTLYVQDGNIYTAAGETLVMRGFNEMFVWSDDPTGERLIPEIDQSGANSLRIVWDYASDKEELIAVIKRTIAHKMVAIPECHNATGKWGEALQACIDFWNDPEIIEVVETNRQWSIVNIANEAGDHSISDAQFVEVYGEAIASLRRWGYSVPIMIDAAGWGQDVDQLLRVAPILLERDPLKNIIFSTHSYWAPEVAVENYKKVAITAKERGLAMIVGEGPSVTRVGQCDDPEPLPYLEGMKLLHQHDAGWLNWSWGGMKNGDCDDYRYFDLTRKGLFGKWWHMPGANIVALSEYGVMQTSRRPPSFYENGVVRVSGVYLHVGQQELSVGESTSLEVIVAPANARNKEYWFRVDGDADSIRIDRKAGRLHGLVAGRSTLTVITEDGQRSWSVPIDVRL